MALLYTIFAMCYFVFNQGAMLKGAGKVISVATGGESISPNGVVLAMVGAFLLYSFFGGLVASAYTDFVQGFLIIVMSFMLIPPGCAAVGGFTGMRRACRPELLRALQRVERRRRLHHRHADAQRPDRHHRPAAHPHHERHRAAPSGPAAWARPTARWSSASARSAGPSPG